MRKNISLSQVSESEQDTRLIEARKVSAEGEILSLSQSKKKIEKDIEELSLVRDSLINTNSSLVAETKVCEKNKIDAQVSFDNEIKRQEGVSGHFKEVISELKKAVENIESEKFNASLSLIEISDKKTALENEINLLKNNISNLSFSKAELIGSVSELEKRIAIINSEINERASLNENLYSSIKQSENRVDELQELVLLKVDELASLDSKVISSKNEIVSLEAKIEDLKKTIEVQSQKFEEISKSAEGRINIATLAEKRVEEKTQYLLKLVEKAKVDGLISNFKI